MIWKCLCIAACAWAALLASHSDAGAKTINMGNLSRSTIGFACARAGAVAFGTENGADQYGCSGSSAVVYCTEDAGCVATVNDLTPVTGNSIDSVLSIGQPGRSLAIRPLDTRIQSQVKPQK